MGTSIEAAEDSKLFHYAGLVAVCACVLITLVYAYLFISHAFIAPYVDDIDSILSYMLQYVAEPDPWKKFALTVHQHNEHRIVGSRIVALISYYGLGSVSFLFGNVAAVFLFIFEIPVLYYYLRSTKRDLSTGAIALVLLPFIALMYQPSGYEGIMWYTVSVASAFVALFALLCFIFVYQESTRSLGYASIFATLATFCQGNGIVLLPLVLVMLLVLGRFRRAGIWALISAVIVALYFSDFVPPAGHPSALKSLSFPLRNLEYVLNFIGLTFADGSSHISTWAGAIQLLMIVGLAIPALFSVKREPVLFSLVLFVLGSMVVNSLSRSEFGVAYTLTQKRYLLLSGMMPATILLLVNFLVIDVPRLRGVIYFTAALSLSFSIYLYDRDYPQMVELSKQNHVGFRQWCKEGVGLTYPWADRAEQIVGDSIETGIYVPRKRNLALFKKRREAKGSAPKS